MSILLYHYTTEEGARGILRDGAIKQSVKKGTGRRQDDARFGSGVYLTNLNPGMGKRRIALNNYDGNPNAVKKILRSGRVDFAIVFKLSRNDPNLKEVGKDDDRDIWLYDGNLQVDPDNEWVIEVGSPEAQAIFGTGSEMAQYI